MSDPFDLPERPLPDGVRAAARQRIAGGLGSRPGRKAPFLIAAAVIVLAAGAVVVTSNVQNLSRTLPPANGATTTSNSFFPSVERSYNARIGWAPDLDVERCVRSATSSHPARGLWQPLVTVSRGGAEVIGFRSPLGPFFCELTPTAVTLSKPSQVTPGDAPAQMLFRSQYGTVAGVVSPDVRSLSVYRDGNPVTSEATLLTDGIFVVPNGFAAAGGLSFMNDDTSVKFPIPNDKLPSISTPSVDRPQQPADRASPAGQRLAACLAHPSYSPFVDPANWQPGAYSDLPGTEHEQLGRYGSLLMTCESDSTGVRSVFVTDLSSQSALAGATIVASRTVYGDKEFALTGLITGDNVASITLSDPGQAPIAATIAEGTFTLAGLSRAQPGMRVMVKDPTGKVLEELALSNN